MNRDWMRQRLEQFVELCDTRDAAYRGSGHQYTGHVEVLDASIRMHMATAREILKRLDPALADDVRDPVIRGARYARAAAQKGLGILRDQDDWKANLEPDAPSLVADQLHPRIWAAASALWDTGSYRVAVEQAAVALSAHIASKAGSHLTERRLVNEVLATSDPPASKTRLHMPGNKSGATWQSRQQGLHLLAQGAFAGIRNVAAHSEAEWPEQVALEHLAVLSVVARWADETEVVEGSEKP